METPKRKKRPEFRRLYRKRKPSVWTPEKMALYAAMRAMGKTIKECAAALGVHPVSLWQAASRQQLVDPDLAQPVPPRILAPWPRWGWFGVSCETRRVLREQYPDG